MNITAFKLLFAFLFLSSLAFSEILKNSKENFDSLMIKKGLNDCNTFFKSKRISSLDNKKFENFFICKFSAKRKRLYIYMLSVDKNEDIGLKEFCKNFILERPLISDNLEQKLNYQSIKYLEGFISKEDLKQNLINKKLRDIVRYKIFINDIKKFKSYTCNWKPGNGIEPYIKLERFKEFNNI